MNDKTIRSVGDAVGAALVLILAFERFYPWAEDIAASAGRTGGASAAVAAAALMTLLTLTLATRRRL